MKRWVRRLLTAGAAGLVLVSASAAIAAASGWSIEPTPELTDGSFQGVSCISERACTAVGGFSRRPSSSEQLAARWNGTKWSNQPAPRPRGWVVGALRSVACASKSACIAVGGYWYYPDVPIGALVAERWNGHRWTIQHTPNPAGARGLSELNGVACVSNTACVAVGDYEKRGGADVTLAERWNGHKWTIQHTPKPAGARGSELDGVACVSKTACTAVGDYYAATKGETLAERWNGHKWSIQHTPKPATVFQRLIPSLNGVACASKTACVAVGDYVKRRFSSLTLAERWNGHKWTIQHTPSLRADRGDYNDLAGVSCASAAACTAVGGYDNGAKHTEAMLAVRWNGHTWSLQHAAIPTGARSAGLNGVACTSKIACTAVGGHGKPLAERWNGG